MGEWKEYRIEDVCSRITSGSTPSRKRLDYFGGSIPWLSSKEVNFNRISRTDECITELGLKNSSAKWIEPNAVIVAMYGATAGRVALSRIRLTTNQACCNLTVNCSKCDYEYLFYHLTSKYDELVQLSSGVAQQNLSLAVLKEFPLLLPSLDEQRAIASVLSSLDAKIDLLHRQNKTLEGMAEALFREWFVEEAEEGWVQRPLSSVANYLNGVACQKYPAKDPLNRLPVLKIKELGSGITESSDWATSTIDPKYHIVAGDVVFSWSATLMVKLWDGPKAVLNQHLFKVTSQEFPKWFFFMWTKHYVDEFVAIATSHATTFGHIKRGDLDEAMVLVPGPERLKEMTFVMDPLFAKHVTNSAKIKSLTSLRDTLLPKLMSGEVRVSLGQPKAITND